MKEKSVDDGRESTTARIPPLTQSNARARAEEIAKQIGGKVIVASNGDIHIVLSKEASTQSREGARARLKEAGVLANDLMFPPDLEPAAEDELEQIGELRSGARPSEELIAEDRGR